MNDTITETRLTGFDLTDVPMACKRRIDLGA
jgi:hypothetical protein